MIIAVDFDGVLHDARRFPRIGEPNRELIEALIQVGKRRHSLVLWTCRSGENLEKAIEWCKEQGLEFNKVNENVKLYRGRDSRKVHAHVYIDDRACRPDEAIERLAKLSTVIGRALSTRRRAPRGWLMPETARNGV